MSTAASGRLMNDLDSSFYIASMTRVCAQFEDGVALRDIF
jgi:hypothetical protein